LFSLHIAFSSAFYNSVSPFAVSIRGPSTTTESMRPSSATSLTRGMGSSCMHPSTFLPFWE
jgi:hypothetical protein